MRLAFRLPHTGGPSSVTAALTGRTEHVLVKRQVLVSHGLHAESDARRLRNQECKSWMAALVQPCKPHCIASYEIVWETGRRLSTRTWNKKAHALFCCPGSFRLSNKCFQHVFRGGFPVRKVNNSWMRFIYQLFGSQSHALNCWHHVLGCKFWSFISFFLTHRS